MKRWIRRILFVLLGFLLVYAAVILVVLFTDMPQNMLLKTLNDKFGLQATVESMEISSGGKTTIKDLAITIPMEDSPVINVPQIIIEHTKIPFVLFQGFKLKKAIIENPLIDIRQNQTGTWNVQRLASFFASDSKDKKSNGLSLPDLEILYAVANITDKYGQKATISPIVLEGKSSKLNVWDFNVDIASQVTINGKLAQTGDIYHEVSIDVNDLPGTLQNLVGDIGNYVKMNANWKGSVHKNGLSGVLQLEKEGSFLVDSDMAINMSPEGLSLDIEEVSVSGLNENLDTIKVLGGKLLYDGKYVKVQKVFAEAAQNQLALSANWNIQERWGDFDCSVTGSIKDKNVDYENVLAGNISWPDYGKKQIEVSIDSHGKSPWGDWQSYADLLGEGQTISNSKWHVTIPSMALGSEKYNIRMDDLQTEIIADWPVVKFDKIVCHNAKTLYANGEFLADSNNWNLSLDAQGLQIIEDQNSPIDLKFAAQGDIKNISVDEFFVSYEDKKIEGNGRLSLVSKELSGANIKTSLKFAPNSNGTGKLLKVSTNIECETQISGTVSPMNLECKSVIVTDDIKVNKQVVKALNITWQATIDSNNVTYNAEEFALFDGLWSLDGKYDLKRRSAQVTLNTEQVSLKPVMQLLELPIDCKGIMKAALDVTLPIDNLEQMVIDGNWNVKDVVIPPMEANEAEGRILIKNGTAQFDKIRLLQGKGIAECDAWFRMNQPEFVYVNVEAQSWPISRNNIDTTTNASGFATLNLLSRTMKAHGDISTNVVIDEMKLANLSADIVVEERLLDFNDMTITALGGKAIGDVSIPMGDWTQSKAYLEWKGIDLSQLALYYPDLGTIEGKSSGSIMVQKADDDRAFEPLRIEIRGTSDNVIFRDANVGNFKASAFLGKERLLIDRAQIDSLSGRIKSYGSVTKQTGQYSIYLNTDISDIETNQLIHAFLPNAKPVAGRLSGQGALVIFSDLKRMTGDADIQITESDFAQTKIIGTLYNTMKLKFGKNKPSGYGQVKLRFEGSSLHIPSFEYFNRGIEVRGSGSILDLANGKKSQVKGYAFGSARPLKGINLLGIGELDKLMTSLQKRVASVQVNGSLEDYNVEVVPFKDISKGLRVLLWDQLHN